MRQDSQSRDHPQTQIDHEGRCNENAVAKAMHAVARQNGPAARCLMVRIVRMVSMVSMIMRVSVFMNIGMMMMLVSMVPKLGLVKQKEKKQAK